MNSCLTERLKNGPRKWKPYDVDFPLHTQEPQEMSGFASFGKGRWKIPKDVSYDGLDWKQTIHLMGKEKYLASLKEQLTNASPEQRYWLVRRIKAIEKMLQHKEKNLLMFPE